MATRNRIRLRRIETEAEGYLELGMPQHALDALARLGEPAKFSSHAFFLWGDALKDLQRYTESLVPLAQAARIAPSDIRAWLAMGWCYKRLGRIDLAIEALQNALASTPGEAILHYNLACYYSLAGDKNLALAHLAEALILDPRYRDLISTEHDFDPIRSDADFQMLTSVIV